jgi:hypothetical protein
VASSSCICFLATMRWVAFLYHVLPTMVFYFTTGPQTMEQPGTQTFEIVSQNKPFLIINRFSKVFYHSGRKLTNTSNFNISWPAIREWFFRRNREKLGTLWKRTM